MFPGATPPEVEVSSRLPFPPLPFPGRTWYWGCGGSRRRRPSRVDHQFLSWASGATRPTPAPQLWGRWKGGRQGVNGRREGKGSTPPPYTLSTTGTLSRELWCAKGILSVSLTKYFPSGVRALDFCPKKSVLHLVAKSALRILFLKGGLENLVCILES